MDETIAVSGELTKANKTRRILEEILKMKDNVRRLDIPLYSHLLSPAQQVSSDDTMIHRENNSIQLFDFCMINRPTGKHY